MKTKTIIYGSLGIIFLGFLSYYLTGSETVADVTTVLVILFLTVAFLLMMVIPVYVWFKDLFNKKR